MKRVLYIMGVALLGAALYAINPPGVPAQQAGTTKVMTVAEAQPQTTAARLAEASLARRRYPAPIIGEASPEPRPEKLFGKK